MNILNLRYSKGGIISAISILLNSDKQKPPTMSSTLSANVAKTKPANSLEVVNAQSEIDALEKQLELETSKLDTLREDKKRIKAIREASDADSSELDTLEIKADGTDDTTAEFSTE